MALPVVPNTNVAMYTHLRVSTDCNETTNLRRRAASKNRSFPRNKKAGKA